MTDDSPDISRLQRAAIDLRIEGTVCHGMMPERLAAVAEATADIRRDGRLALREAMIVTREIGNHREEIARRTYDGRWVTKSQYTRWGSYFFSIARRDPSADTALGEDHVYLLERAIDFGSIDFTSRVSGGHSRVVNLCDVLKHLEVLEEDARYLRHRLATMRTGPR